MSASRLYVGGLDPRLTERDLEDEFGRYGRIREVWLARKPPGFAFVEMDDVRDAEDAVRKLDGYKGWRVEFSRRRPTRGRSPIRGRGSELRCYECGEVGHLARDCRRPKRSQGRRDSPVRRRRSASRSPRRSRSPHRRSRSASRSPRRRSRTPSRSRSRSPEKKKSRSPSRERSRSRSRSRERSRSRSATREKSRSRSATPARSRSISRSP